MNGRFLKLWLPLALFAVFLLFPFYWMVLTSLRPNAELVSATANPFWVQHPTFEHIQYLFRSTSFPRWFWNTMLIATGASRLGSSSFSACSAPFGA